MKKNIFLSIAASAVMATMSYAGGDIIIAQEPVAVIPVEPTAAKEATPIYIGAGLNRGVYHNTKCGNCEYEDVTYGVTLRAGYDFNQYIGVEARYVGTYWDADELGGQELQHLGLYVKPMYPMNEQFNVYALLGYGMTTTATGGNKNLDELDDNGFAAGAGMEYGIDTANEWGLFLDYQRLLISSDVPDMDVISAGLTYDF